MIDWLNEWQDVRLRSIHTLQQMGRYVNVHHFKNKPVAAWDDREGMIQIINAYINWFIYL